MVAALMLSAGLVEDCAFLMSAAEHHLVGSLNLDFAKSHHLATSARPHSDGPIGSWTIARHCRRHALLERLLHHAHELPPLVSH